MIHQSITKYKPPAPAVTYQQTSWKRIDQESLEWIEKCQVDLALAISKCKINDKIFLKSVHNTSPQTVTGFVSDPKTIRHYRDNPCVILARDMSYQHGVPIHYSLDEIDFNKGVVVFDVTGDYCNDEC